MAGQYARVNRSIVADDDFRGLTLEAKVVYLYLLFQPKLSPCGALDYMPSRVARQIDIGRDRLDVAVAELEEHRYVIHDPDTEEIAIRTYVRHDFGGNANSVKAVYNALDQLASVPLREAIVANLPRDMPPDPRTTGRRAVADRTTSGPGPNAVRTPSEPRSKAVGTSLALSPPPDPRPAAAAPADAQHHGGSCRMLNEGAAAAAAIEALADLELDQRIAAGTQVRNRATYRIPIVADLRESHLDQAMLLARENPVWTVDELVAALLPGPAVARWEPNIECDICCGSPWLYDDTEGADDSVAYRCPACYPAELGDAVLPSRNPA